MGSSNKHLPKPAESHDKEVDPDQPLGGSSKDVSRFFNSNLHLEILKLRRGLLGLRGVTGRLSTSNIFNPYGEPYALGDVIAAYLDLEWKPPNMSFAKNGQWLGMAAPQYACKVGCSERNFLQHIISKNSWWMECYDDDGRIIVIVFCRC